MKYRLIVFLQNFILISTLYSQVGINTTSPLAGVLHIDSKGNSSSGVFADDVFVSSNGNMSIGHINPSTKLDIHSESLSQEAFILEDGTQGENKVLLSDVNGVARWAVYPGELVIVRGQLNQGLPDLLISYLATMTHNPPSFIYANASITLPPGRWLVSMSMRIQINSSTPNPDQRIWMRGSLVRQKPIYSDGTIETIPFSSEIVSGLYVSGLGYSAGYGLMGGYSVVVNSETEDVTYYWGLRYPSNINVVATDRLSKFAYASVDYQENQIVAIKMANN